MSDILAALLENITDATNGMDKLASEWIVDLGSKPTHMDFDHIGIAIEVDVPDLLGNQSSG